MKTFEYCQVFWDNKSKYIVRQGDDFFDSGDVLIVLFGRLGERGWQLVANERVEDHSIYYFIREND